MKKARSGPALSPQRSCRAGSNRSKRQHVTRRVSGNPTMPVRVGSAQCGRRHRIWIESQLIQRRGIPPHAQSAISRPVLPEPPAPAAQPGHGGARHSFAVIARTRDNRNRHRTRDCAPVPPSVKLRQIVRAHQPDKPEPGKPPLQLRQRIDGIARAQFRLDRADPDRRATRHALRADHACGQRGHAFDRFQDIAGRHQPPHFIEPQCRARMKADPPVRCMRRIETAAKQADSLVLQNQRQGRI